MWLITTCGFFSIVQKQGNRSLIIRACVKKDLVALREAYLPRLGRIKKSDKTNYRYQAEVSHDELAEALGNIVRDIAYHDFAQCVAEKQGLRRAYTYRMWEQLFELSEEDGKGGG